MTPGEEAIGVLTNRGLNFELGVDAQWREGPLGNGRTTGSPDHGALARATMRW